MLPEMLALMLSSPWVRLARVARPERLACLLGLLLGFPVGGLAHTDAYLDTQQSPHGGQVRMAGPMHLELVVKATAVEVFVTDHAGAPLPTQNGKALVRTGPDGAGTVLHPAGANRFAGSLAKLPLPDAEFTLFVRLAGEEAQSARYSLRVPEAGSKASAAPQPRSSPEEKPHAHHAQ